MADISDTEKTINYEIFREMSGYYFLYKEIYGKEPSTIPIGNDTITLVRYKDMLIRTKDYVRLNGVPKAVWIKKPVPKPKKSQYHLAEEQRLGRTYENFTQWYGGMIGRGYSKYLSDKFNEKEEEENVRKHIAMNCTDYTQHAKKVANDMGYEFAYVHIKCLSGTGHVYGLIKGKEFKDWTRVDVAAAASVGSKYPIGKVWCESVTPKVVSSADSTHRWLLVNDGDA